MKNNTFLHPVLIIGYKGYPLNTFSWELRDSEGRLVDFGSLCNTADQAYESGKKWLAKQYAKEGYDYLSDLKVYK
jgi:hypothetical protein